MHLHPDHHPRLIPLALAALLAALFLLPATARAEGPLSGGTRIYVADEPVGSLDLSSFAAPNPPVTTDRIWVTVQLRDGAKAVDDARVWVVLSDPDGAAVQRVEATHELAAQSFDYTAALPVPESGTYLVTLEVEHPQGSGTVAYNVNVSEPLTRWIFFLMAIPALLLLLALGHRFVARLPEPAAVLAGDDGPLER